MSVYAGKHPHTEALMWAWQQVSGSDKERRAKAEILAEWVLTWAPSKAAKNEHVAPKPFIDPLTPVETWKPVLPIAKVASYAPKPYDPLTPQSLQDFLGALSSAASIATPALPPEQVGAAAGGVVPVASPAMSSLSAHRSAFDETSPSGYR